MGWTAAAGSQCGNEGQRVGCPSEAVMNWRTRLDLGMFSGKLTSASPSRFDALFRFQRFPTRFTLYVGIVIRERDHVIMECRRVCNLSPRGRFYTCLISINDLIGQVRVRHAADTSTSTCRPNPRIKPISTLQSSDQTPVTLRSSQQPNTRPRNKLEILLRLSRT